MKGIVVVAGAVGSRERYAAAIVAEAQRRRVPARQAPWSAATAPAVFPVGAAVLWSLIDARRTWGRWRRWSRSGIVVTTGGWHDDLLRSLAHEADGSWFVRSLPLWTWGPRAAALVLLCHPADAPGAGLQELTGQLAGWMSEVVVDAEAGEPPLLVAERTLEALTSGRPRAPLAWARTPLTLPESDGRATVGPAARPVVSAIRSQRFGRATTRLNSVLLSRGLSVAQVEPVEDLAGLCSEIGVRPESMASMRLDRSGRRLVAIAADGRVKVFVKLGAMDDAGLANEATWLAALDGEINGVVVPRLVWDGTWHGRRVLATAPVERLHRPARRSPYDAALEASLRLCGSGLPSPARQCVHGDLAPWNLLATAKGPALVDWEHARQGDAPLHDLAHFVVQRGELLRRTTPDDAVAELVAPGRIGWRYLEVRGLDPATAPAHLRSYLRSLRKAGSFHQLMRSRLDD